MTQWALRGNNSRQLLTLGGKVLVHNSEQELRFLFKNAEPVKVKIPDAECLPLWGHPDLYHISFPLDLKEFAA